MGTHVFLNIFISREAVLRFYLTDEHELMDATALHRLIICWGGLILSDPILDWPNRTSFEGILGPQKMSLWSDCGNTHSSYIFAIFLRSLGKSIHTWIYIDICMTKPRINNIVFLGKRGKNLTLAQTARRSHQAKQRLQKRRFNNNEQWPNTAHRKTRKQ